MIIDIFYGKMSFHRIEEELAFTFPDMIGKCCHGNSQKNYAGDKLSKRDRNIFMEHFESMFTSRFCFSMQRGLYSLEYCGMRSIPHRCFYRK